MMFKLLIAAMVIPFDPINLLFLVLVLWRCRKWDSLTMGGLITGALLACLSYLLSRTALITPSLEDIATQFSAFLIDLYALRVLQKGLVAVWQKRALKTRAQRIAFLSLCASLLLLIGQLAVYGYYVASIYYWDHFWSRLSNCLSLGASYRYGCTGDDIISRSLMYFNIIWITASLICTLWWQPLTILKAAVQRWIVNG